MRRILEIAIPSALITIIISVIIIMVPPTIALSFSDNHYTIVGDSWHYAGNETLYIEPGSPGETLCEFHAAPQTVCETHWGRHTPIDVADKYISTFGQPAYVVTADINNGNTHDIVVLYNSKIYCILPDPNYPVIAPQSADKTCTVK